MAREWQGMALGMARLGKGMVLVMALGMARDGSRYG
jgi:hypothetical protein